MKPTIKFTAAVEYITSRLQELENYGHRPSRIVQDWVVLCHALLSEIPRHYKSRAEGVPHVDLPETTQAIESIKEKYGDNHELLLSSISALLEMVEKHSPDRFYDFLGHIYMMYGYPNAKHGQFFTPKPVADLLSLVASESPSVFSTPQIKEKVDARLKQAILSTEESMAAMMILPFVSEFVQEAWFIARVVAPALAKYEPVTVHDPTCGSGLLLLSVAEKIPNWQIKMGLVQFYGQDIDPYCGLMAQSNLLLYGLNGTMILPYAAGAEEAVLRYLAGERPEQPEQPRSDLVTEPTREMSVSSTYTQGSFLI